MNWQVYHGKVGHTHGGHSGSSSDRSGEGNWTIVPIKAYDCMVGSDGAKGLPKRVLGAGRTVEAEKSMLEDVGQV